MPRADGLRVPKRLGQKTIELATELMLIEKGLKIRGVGDFLIIPLARKPSRDEEKKCEEILHDFEIVTGDFSEKARTVESLVEALEDVLPPHLIASLPRSMDVIGRVAILEIPPELEEWKSVVGKAVLEVKRGVGTVLAKAGIVGGEYRLRRFEVIAGTGGTETVHKEYGCVYHLDPTEVYFSPRLSEERRRVAAQVKEGETIVDMFASIGPFSIQIAKSRNNVKVYAIDANEKAFHYLKKNVEANKVENVVIPVVGDVRLLAERFEGVADRVIMDLPERAAEFVDVACRILKPKGGMIHFYCFESEPSSLGKAEETISKKVLDSNRTLQEIIEKRLVRQVAPGKWQVAVDALVR